MILNRIINHGRTLPSGKACGSWGGGGGGLFVLLMQMLWSIVY